MIALRDNLPLIRFADGQIMAFERNWLASSITQAAERAGYKKWWLAPHVIESITNYFENEFNENTVTVRGLEKAVQSVLQVIGYGEVAGHFHAAPPPARISLEEIARDAGHGYELAFFDLLRSRLREAVEAKPQRLEICDAHRGVKMLRSAKVWRRDCSGLLDEIVNFIRNELNTVENNAQLEMLVS